MIRYRQQSAEGAEGTRKVECEEGVSPVPPLDKKFSIFYLKTATFVTSMTLFFTVHLPVLEAKTDAVGLKNSLLRACRLIEESKGTTCLL